MKNTKKIVIIGLSLLVLLSCAVMFSCGKNDESAVAVVTFMLDGEQYAKKEYADAKTAVYPPEPKKKGHTFSNWYQEQLLTTPFNLTAYVSNDKRESITVYGSFSKDDILLRFNNQGGKEIPPMIVTESVAEPTAPLRDGYNFYGWFNEDRCKTRVAFPLTLTENKTIYAKWEEATDNGMTFAYINNGFTLTKYTNTYKEIIVDDKVTIVVDTQVTIPTMYDEIPVLAIGNSVFSDNSDVTTIILNDGLTTIGASAFANSLITDITIPNTVTTIGASAFANSLITSITIPNTVTNIEGRIFESCAKLTTVTFEPNSNLTALSENMFEGSGIQNISLPDSLKAINKYAFYNCRALTSITIPNTVTNIEERIFKSCTKLETVTFESNSKLTALSENMFEDSGIQNILLPDSITAINIYAFYNCRALTSITIPQNVTNIDERAFSGCSALTSITIPQNVTNIGVRAFDGCSALTSVTFAAPTGWIISGRKPIIDKILTNETENATFLTTTYVTSEWRKA